MSIPTITLTEDAVLDRSLDLLLDGLIDVGQAIEDAERAHRAIEAYREAEDPERFDGMS